MAQPLVRHASALLAAVALVALTGPSSAQDAPKKMTAKNPIVLGTVTPLGEAAITIPAGAVVPNYELQGEMVRIWQGPFTATIRLDELQEQTEATPTPTPGPEATAQVAAAQEADTPPEVEETAQAAQAVPNPIAASSSFAALPPWALPAACGALLAYAIFTTLALLRSRAAQGGGHKRSGAAESAAGPVVAIASGKGARPAVVSEGGRAIACPLCAKNIPLEKISKGRNVCPSCGGAFVGE